MRNNLRNLAASTLLIAAFGLQAQSFEGTIEFTKTTGPVVTNYRYFVKEGRVRIEEISAKGIVQGIMLVDTHKKSVVALSPDRRLYMDVPNMRLPKDMKADLRKTGETKQIAGNNCEKWVAKSTVQDRQLTYWVAKGGFDFFLPMLETLNRKDEQAVFFMKFDDAAGMFPMLGIEQKLDGTEVSRLEVTKVVRSEQRVALFEVPKEYTKFERN